MTRLVLCVALLTVLVCGCAEEAPREGGARDTTGPPRPAPQTITEVDSGESFTLPPGSETHLRLSGRYAWSEPTVRGNAVELARVDYFQDPGFSEWTIVAVRRGTATIAARGTPDCPDRERCPDGPLRFAIEIAVAP